MTSGLPLVPQADAWLVDDRWSKAYALGTQTHIGRGSESSIILRDPVISRRHASVFKDGDSYVLNVFGASGTKLNGVPVDKPSALKEGDLIEIAFTTLRFTMMAPTGEMFVVARDTPTLIDRQEGPTRATLRAPVMRESILARHPMALFIIALLAIALLFFLAGGGRSQ